MPLPALSTATAERTPETSAPGLPSVPNPFGLHSGTDVPPTPKELVHVLDELPKKFTKGLLGSVPESMISQAVLYIGRKSMAHGVITSCRLGLMYRPDRASSGFGR